MEPAEKEKLSRLLGKDYIERKAKRQTVTGKDGSEIPVIDTQKVTGGNVEEGIVDAELDRITEYDCGCPAEGRVNYGGKCAICKATFCNKMINGRPSCYRRCIICHRKICMSHVRGLEGSPVLCSVKCRIIANPKTLLIPLIIVILLFALFKALSR